MLEIDEIIANKQNDVSHLRKEHIIIAQTPVLTDVDVKTLETLQEALRTQRDELACLSFDFLLRDVDYFILSE